MALVASLEGIRILMYPSAHPLPHFHARFGEFEAQISVATGDIFEGSLPVAKARALRQWHVAKRDELAYVWVRIHTGQPFTRIGP